MFNIVLILFRRPLISDLTSVTSALRSRTSCVAFKAPRASNACTNHRKVLWNSGSESCNELAALRGQELCLEPPWPLDLDLKAKEVLAGLGATLLSWSCLLS
jgi:hypothetical protein